MALQLQTYASTTQWRTQVRDVLDHLPFIFLLNAGTGGDDTAAFTAALLDGRPIALDPTKTYRVSGVSITPATDCQAIFGFGGQARIVNATTDADNGRCFYISKDSDFLFDSLFFDLPISTDPVTKPGFNRALEFSPDSTIGTNYRVTNCRFSGASFAITMADILRNCRIADNYFTGTWRDAIAAQCVQNVEIVDNVFEDGGYATGGFQPAGAIRIGYSLQLEYSLDVLISRNIIARYCVNSVQSGIDCYSGSASGIRISDNIIEECGAGIELKTSPWSVSTPDIYEDNAVQNNTIRLRNDIVTSGINIFHATILPSPDPKGKEANTKLSGNLISCLVAPGSGGSVYGISTSGCDDVTIDGNTINRVSIGISVSGVGADTETSTNITICGNTVDCVDHAIVRSGSTDTVDGLYIRGNPLLRCASSGFVAVGLYAGTTTNAEVSGNRIESLDGAALELRDVTNALVFDNTLIADTSGVVSQGTAPSGVKIRGNQIIATTGPGCNLSVGTGIEIQNNDVDVPVGSRSWSGAATVTAAGNTRGMTTANPSATAGGALGDIFLDSTAATAGWRCTTAGAGGGATYTVI